MPKRNNDPNIQPKLLAESQAEYQLTSEELAAKEGYRQRLVEYLKDPTFRQIEGFPNGEDEDILALSDPPYYTACPNPFMEEIIALWQGERQALRKEFGLPDDIQENGFQLYHREPFAADVSEGKNDPIYNAHSYHTKVPHKAIMRYILHYTDPGDIVLDGFCGTGMTGVAAQLCGDKKAVESLGYIVQKDGRVLDEKGQLVSSLGSRKTVLVDISPAATFIAYNYNKPVDAKAFEREAERILKAVEKECSWMYETWHPNCDDPKRTLGQINYIIWSDVFVCSHCGSEMAFWDVAVDHKKGTVHEAWDCPGCGVLTAKTPAKGSDALRVERAWQTRFDRDLKQTVRQARQVPVLINYSVGKRRYEKRPDTDDLALIERIENSEIPYSCPILRMPEGDESRRNDDIGFTHVHHFYTKRNLWVLSSLWAKSTNNFSFRWALSGIMQRANKQHQIAISRVGSENKQKGGKTAGHRRGTLYIPSNQVEFSVFRLLAERLKYIKLAKTATKSTTDVYLLSCASSNNLKLKESCIDYLFVDPPFGQNIMYSELNVLWEAWLNVVTNNKQEAVINRAQRKALQDYQVIMEDCFSEFYRLLKPGHWMTIEFHNSQNSVWNAIQEAVMRSGFVVADVRTLDKVKKTHTQVTASGSVKQDLVISAYKPTAIFERQFKAEAGSIQGAWAFVRQHLEQLPIPSVENGIVESLSERQNYLLYDRMVAFHVMRGLAIPLSASEFYQGLAQRYLERDGMYFTPAQAAEYDRLRLKAERVEQLALFVIDEKSAVQWLRQALDPSLGGEPQTYQDLQPKFIQQLHQASHEKLPELRQMLEENFLQDEAERWYNPNPDRKADLEALRQRTLLREYKEYLKGKGRLKIFRSEAVRAGFSADWKERNYADIVLVAERLPENVLQEDQGLLMYYHNASLRLSDKPKQAKML